MGDETMSVSRRAAMGIIAIPFATAAMSGSRTVIAVTRAGDARETDTFDIRDYGAVGDGKTLNTKGVQAAIDACTANGGGTVLVPAGNFLIGTIELKANVRLYVSAGGMLVGSSVGTDYHAAEGIPLNGAVTMEQGNWALVYAVKAERVTVEGPGRIVGNGNRYYPQQAGQIAAALEGNHRPHLLLFFQCANLVVRDVELMDSAYQCVRVIYSSYVRMEGIHIYSRATLESEGFHFIYALHLTVSNCTVECVADACGLFDCCQDVMVTNSIFSTRGAAFRFEGGPAWNIAVSNCILEEVHGCAVKLIGQGITTFDHISFSNLVMKNVTGPIHLSIGPEQCVARNISFSNIHGTVTTNPEGYPDIQFPLNYSAAEKMSAIVLSSVGDGVLENISLSDVHLTFGGGGTEKLAAMRKLPEAEVLGPIPAYGMYARNVRGLTLNNMRLAVESPELRPAMILEGVRDAVLTGISMEGNVNAESVMRVMDSEGVLVTSPRVLEKANVFMRVEGTQSSRITVEGGDISLAKNALAFAEGAREAAVKIRG